MFTRDWYLIDMGLDKNLDLKLILDYNVLGSTLGLHVV